MLHLQKGRSLPSIVLDMNDINKLIFKCSTVPQMALQFLNQSFNAVVNYSNRGGDDKTEKR